MSIKTIGGILLIVGTTIGAGMLALPIVTAESGFWGAIALLFASWIVMTFSAFFILEVNLWLPFDSNIILMAKRTLGPWAALIAWVCYLLLFYCLLAAYVAGGSDILQGLLIAMGYHFSVLANALLFIVPLGLVVYKGIKSVDYANRFLMLIKLLSFVLLILLVLPHAKSSNYSFIHFNHLAPAVAVTLTSFGFATLVPSLRGYFNNEVPQLRKVILIGSLIPLACYIFWIIVVFGTVPYEGEYGLLSMVKSEHSTLALTQALIFYLKNNWVTTFTRFFTSICVFTSFLGVSLCVVDFLADGLSLEKVGLKKLLIHLITFIPPLAIAIYFPDVFIIGLNYAGMIIGVLILILPAMMIWNGRYRKKIATGYQVMGGKFPILLVIMVGMFVIVQGIL